MLQTITTRLTDAGKNSRLKLASPVLTFAVLMLLTGCDISPSDVRFRPHQPADNQQPACEEAEADCSEQINTLP